MTTAKKGIVGQGAERLGGNVGGPEVLALSRRSKRVRRSRQTEAARQAPDKLGGSHVSLPSVNSLPPLCFVLVSIDILLACSRLSRWPGGVSCGMGNISLN